MEGYRDEWRYIIVLHLLLVILGTQPLLVPILSDVELTSQLTPLVGVVPYTYGSIVLRACNNEGSLEAYIHSSDRPIMEPIEEEIELNFPIQELWVVLE
jgi:hypothetical protein